MIYSLKTEPFFGHHIVFRKNFSKSGIICPQIAFSDVNKRRKNMKAKHALYLGLIIIGASFLMIDATALGLILEGVGAVLLLISALLEWAGEHQDPHP